VFNFASYVTQPMQEENIKYFDSVAKIQWYRPVKEP
jgi:hypothetical protein